MTPVATMSNPVLLHANTEKAEKHKDGSIVLSIADDRVCRLNGVGALTWMIFEENPKGLSVDEVARELGEQFEAINSEGELRYEVSPEQLRDDTAGFVNKMSEMNLLKPMTDSRRRVVYCLREGVSGTTSATSAHTERSQCTEMMESESADDDIRLSKRETLTAFIGLAAFDLLLKLRGFQSLIKKVEQWPTAEPRTTDRELCRRIRAMVDRAQMYYPKKAMCLQHSAVVTCLLRRKGVPAEMVLGARAFPPEAHAWAEVKGEVINDKPTIKTKYQELRRV
jgi:nitrous oxide reductase accessory protein NosL